MGPVVAIDGPAGSGKSTVATRLAERLGVPHVDTGAMYRAVTLACLRGGVDPADGEACGAVAGRVRLGQRSGRTLLDGEDVSEEIRDDRVTAAVSSVAAHQQVRDAITPHQRRLAREQGAVVEGRDIGTVVLPDADLKVYLTASVEERARRRAEQQGTHDAEGLAQELRRRDQEDSTREAAPLARAEDAWELDTTDLSVDEVVDVIAARLADGPTAAPPGGQAHPPGGHSRLPRVAVVGRANVGKSTLVNRALERRAAVVDEQPGVTRDRTEHEVDWAGRRFVMVDTGGWDRGPEGLGGRIVDQARRAVEEADAVVMVVDVTVGALDEDEECARLLRRADVPVLLAANKVDGRAQEPLAHELYSLGLGEPWLVSAVHGRGMGDLLDAVVDQLPDAAGYPAEEPPVPAVAIVGRPNVGKSSLFNRLVGDERAIVDPVAHTTRDAVDARVELDGEPWIIVDTAGMRRRYRQGEDPELYSVDRTRAAVRRADLALFVVDGAQPLSRQDQRLAAMIRDAGCGIVLVVNKWDLVDDRRRRDLERELARLLRFVTWVPRINVSALTGRGVRRLAPTLRGVWNGYASEFPARELDQVLAETADRSPPPPSGGRQVRIQHAAQVGTRPPTVAVTTNRPLTDEYRRHLESRLREHYDLLGVPVRVVDRQGDPGAD